MGSLDTLLSLGVRTSINSGESEPSVDAWYDGQKWHTATVAFPSESDPKSNDGKLNKQQNPQQGTLCKTLTGGAQKQKAIKTKDSLRCYHNQKEASQMSGRKAFSWMRSWNIRLERTAGEN